MNTFQLTCFLAVSDTLNFARAAEQLAITQPAVTHQIHSLEAELNVKLFRRTTRNVELTSEGILFLNDARNIVELSIRAKKRFKSPFQEEIQIFSIGCQNALFFSCLSEVLSKLALRFSALYPRLKIVPFQHLYRLLEEEEIDAIIGFQEPASKKNFFYKEMKKMPVSYVCSRSHPLSSNQTIKYADIQKERLVLSLPKNAPISLLQFQNKLIDECYPSSFYFCESFEAVITLVKANFGISILPDLFIPSDQALVRIPLEDFSPISFGVYYKTLQGNLILKNFLELMDDHF